MTTDQKIIRAKVGLLELVSRFRSSLALRGALRSELRNLKGH
jgi:hypothetical protein